MQIRRQRQIEILCGVKPPDVILQNALLAKGKTW